jgi:aryl-alcohol dehydrogenase-like predicted oxidoreductase
VKKRELGNTGVELTVIGLGTWAIGGPWQHGWGPQDDEDSIKTIRRALDLGINWIDTAAAYGLGHSEKVCGQAIEGRRDEVFVATKCGLVPDDEGKVHRNLTPESIRREVEDSLRRLDVDVIDLYQFHWPDTETGTPIEESWSAAAELVKEGKVRHMGLSNFNIEQMERCRPIHPIASLQPPYHMMQRDIEDEILPYCAEHGIGVVVYSPMHSGLLTERFDPDKISEDDWRHRLGADHMAKAKSIVEGLEPIAEKHDATVAQVSVAWTLRRPEVTSAIVGARRVWQAEQNVEAAKVELTDEDIAKIDALLA